MNIDDITLDQLSGDQYDLAELIGIDTYKRLVKVYGGSFVYICKADTVMKAVRNKEICEKFNGYNHRELAIEYNLSEKTIRDITADRLREVKNKPMEGQLKLE